MKDALIVGFQGIGLRRQYTGESTLIKVGHVGVSLDHGLTIFGFHPTQASVNALLQDTDFDDETSERIVIEFLQMGGVLRGGVFDDTTVFRRARELSTYNSKIQVWKVSLPISDSEFENIHETITTEIHRGSPFPSWYGFPQGLRPCHNCATWLRQLGLPPLEESGRLVDYIERMRLLGIAW